MFKADELQHLTALVVASIHDSILDSESGLKGTRKDMSVEGMIGRIHSNLYYQGLNSIEEVTALYAEVIAKGHVFNDGNKRTAFVSMVSFLELNDYQILVEDEDGMADKMVELADGKTDYKEFSAWLKAKIIKT